jgi:NTE family protein
VTSPQHPLDEQLHAHLRAFLEDTDDGAIRTLQAGLEWQELPAGGVLMRQGELGDAMYVLASGRLRVSITGADGRSRAVREITRGQVVGEMSLITDAPRSATIVAVRDSVLARLGRPGFDALLRQHPAVSMALTRQIITRLQTQGHGLRPDRPVVIALVPLGGRVDANTARQLADGVAAELGRHGRVAQVDAAAIAARMGQPPGDDAESARRMAVALDGIEAEHDVVLLLADAAPTAWTRCCARQGDEVLLLGHADDDPGPGAIEAACRLAEDDGRPSPSTVLVLLQPPGRAGPTGTARWRAPRRLRAHVHLREGDAASVARLGRLLGRRGVGLVLSGGGARGAAHVGVYRALCERGVPVDAVAGTSMGAVLGAMMAFDTSADQVRDTFAKHFADNPTGDWTMLPLLSLVKGERLRGMMDWTEQRFGGAAGLGIEDLWKPYTCIATNVSRASEVVLSSGPLVPAVMASCAIPGALPPVLVDGELLCDGGVLNNFPVDVMRGTWGIGRVVGVDLGMGTPRRLDIERMPTPWQLLRDRLRPKRQRRYRLPSLPNYLMNVTALHGTARQRAAVQEADLVVRPVMPRIGMLQWRRYAEAVQQGYDDACQALEAAGIGPGGAGGLGRLGG